MFGKRRDLNKRSLDLSDSTTGKRVGVFLINVLLLGLVLLFVTVLNPWSLIWSGHGKLVGDIIQYMALIVIFVPGRDRWSRKLRDASHEYSGYVAGTLVGSFAAEFSYDMLRAALGNEHAANFACILVLLAVQRVIIIVMRHERLARP
jgi:hypothetical protein